MNYKTNIKPYNPVSQIREQNYMKRDTAPGAGPLTLPKEPQAPMPQPFTNPGAFSKLKSLFSRGR